jgi:aminopeptidase N
MIARNAVEYMSNDLPGWPFPYPQVTVFANGRKTGGMEFPMMANDGAPDDYADLQGLTFHEIFHNYFPFFMGTNERKYAFMDEGWARYLPTGFLEKHEPKDNYLERTMALYSKFAGSENEMPPMTPTYIINDYQSQRMATYTRPAIAYHFLRESLGPEIFKVALLEFIERWQGRHPSPYDFFNTFNNVAGEDLSWYWAPWFFEQGYPDLGIKDITEDNLVLVEKLGNIPVPVEITITYIDGSEEMISRSARVWRDGAKLVAIQLYADKEVKEITLGSDLIPDSFRENNLWRREK